jgi:hypothetical protein
MKREKTMAERIIIAIRNEKRITGRDALTKSIWPNGWTLDNVQRMNAELYFLICDSRVIETKNQLPGTGHEGPPVFEYVYTLKGTKS